MSSLSAAVIVSQGGQAYVRTVKRQLGQIKKMTKRRSRSVTLDADLVRAQAKALGIISLSALNDAILKYRNDSEGRATKAGDKAWNGLPLQRDHADEVARVLQVRDYRQLLNLPSSSLWSRMRSREENHREILEILLESEISNRHLFTLDDAEKQKEWKISKNDSWRLKLRFKPHYHILAIIRNEARHVFITPSRYEFPRYFDSEVVTIPDKEQWLRFDPAEQSGWREIIVIACKQDIFPVITESDDNNLDSAARERVASKLLEPALVKDYAIDSIAFELID